MLLWNIETDKKCIVRLLLSHSILSFVKKQNIYVWVTGKLQALEEKALQSFTGEEKLKCKSLKYSSNLLRKTMIYTFFYK